VTTSLAHCWNWPVPPVSVTWRTLRPRPWGGSVTPDQRGHVGGHLPEWPVLNLHCREVVPDGCSPACLSAIRPSSGTADCLLWPTGCHESSAGARSDRLAPQQPGLWRTRVRPGRLRQRRPLVRVLPAGLAAAFRQPPPLTAPAAISPAIGRTLSEQGRLIRRHRVRDMTEKSALADHPGWQTAVSMSGQREEIVRPSPSASAIAGRSAACPDVRAPAWLRTYPDRCEPPQDLRVVSVVS
jgi:hypothetical protein